MFLAVSSEFFSWFWFFPEQSRMKGFLYTPGFSVYLDMLVWVFLSSAVTPLCDDLDHGDLVVYTRTV